MASRDIVNKNDGSAMQKTAKGPTGRGNCRRGLEDVDVYPLSHRCAMPALPKGEPLADRAANTDCLGSIGGKIAGAVLNHPQLRPGCPAFWPARRRRAPAFRAGSHSGRTRW